jgi:hypothetical protein
MGGNEFLVSNSVVVEGKDRHFIRRREWLFHLPPVLAQTFIVVRVCNGKAVAVWLSETSSKTISNINSSRLLVQQEKRIGANIF